MKLLLDEGVPKPLRRKLVGHSVLTVQNAGWASIQNGELLRRAEAAGFQLLITCDQNLGYQQNLAGRKIALIILPRNQLSVVLSLVDQLLVTIQHIQPGDYVELQLP